MSDLAAWLLEQIAADEEAARRSASLLLIIRTERCAVIGSDEHQTYMHYDRYGPARVLAERAAKRRLVESHYDPTPDPDYHELFLEDCPECRQIQPCRTLRMLAQPYADRPGWRQEWAL